MCYSTPSERWLSSARRFLYLLPLDYLRLGRTTWMFALISCGCQLIFASLSIIPYVHAAEQFLTSPLVVFAFVGPLLVRIVEAVLWLLIIRLVLEGCLHVLGGRGGQSSATDYDRADAIRDDVTAGPS